MPTMTQVAAAVLGLASGLNGGGAFVPSLPASGLIANWKADSLAQGDGTAVSTWTDSINGIVANQATGANQPSFKVNSLGGKPAIVFAGSHWLPIATPGVIDTAIAAGNYTILMAVDNVLTVGFGTVFGASAGGNSQLYVATGSYVGRYGSSLPGAHAAPAVGNATPATFTTFGATSQKPYPMGSGSGHERIVVRGGIVGGQTTAPPVATAGYGIGSLSAAGNNASFNFKGRIYEIVIWNRALSPLELLQAEDYFCSKYSQTNPRSGASAFHIWDGDSQVYNVGATIPTGLPYQVMSALSIPYGQWTNTAVGGIKIENNIVKASEFSGIPNYVGTRVVISAFEYYNAFLAGDSSSTLFTQANSYISTVKAYGSNVRVVWGTDLSNTSDPSAIRSGYNALCDATPPGDQYVAQHIDTTIGISGAATANPTFFYDGVHLSPTGYAIQFPYWTPKVSAAIAMA